MTGRAYNLTQGYILSKIDDGEAYITNSLSTVAGNSTTNVHIRNPEGSAASMWVCGFGTIMTRSGVVRMHDQFDSISDGTEYTIQNAEMDPSGGAPDDGPFEAYKDSTYTESDEATIPLGVSGKDQFQTTDFIYFPMVAREGREFVVEVENTSSNEAQVLISMFLTEN